MSIIKADKVEVEIQEQTDPESAAQYMTVVSYQPEGLFSKEIVTVLLSNTKPFIKKTVDLGNRVVRKEKDWFVGNNLNDKIYTGPLNEVKEKLKKDESKLTPDGFKA